MTMRTRTGFARPPRYPSRIEDWPRLMCATWRTEAQWLSEPDITAWMAASRLNLMRALPDHRVDRTDGCQARSHPRRRGDRADEYLGQIRPCDRSNRATDRRCPLLSPTRSSDRSGTRLQSAARPNQPTLKTSFAQKVRLSQAATARRPRTSYRQLRDGAVASAVIAIAGKSAAPLRHANGSAVVLALAATRCDLQPDLAVALAV